MNSLRHLSPALFLFTVFLAPFLSSSQVCTRSQLPPNLQDGLVAFYPFCGNANDASGNGNNGTVSGPTLSSDRFGSSNAAYTFGSGLITIPHRAYFSIAQGGEFSISLWVRKTGSENPAHIIGKRDQSAHAFNWQIAQHIGAGGVLFSGATGINGNNTGVLSNQALTQNVWQHLVGIYRAGNWKLYRDAMLIGETNSLFFQPDLTNATLQIGNSGGWGAFGGQIDDIMIYNRALNPCEVWQIFNANSTGFPVSSSLNFNPLSDTTRICGNQTTLDAGSGFSSYRWNTGASSRSITANTGGFYSVTVTNASGCSVSDTTFLNILSVRVTPTDTSFCKNSSLSLLAVAQDVLDTMCFRPSVKTSGNILSFASSVVRDRFNNIFHSGVFSGNISIGGTALSGIGGRDFFISKYDNCGNLIWAIRGGSNGSEDITGGMTTDNAGNLYVVGRYNQTCTIYGTGGSSFEAPYTITSNAGHQDGFLVKISPSGAVLWGVTIRGGSNDGFERVAVDPSGNPIVTGQFNGCCPGTFASVVYGTTNTFNLSSSGSNYSTGIVVKFNSSGTVLWALRVYSRDGAVGPVKADASGNIYASGTFRTWSSGTPAQISDGLNATSSLVNPGIGLGFLLKIAPNGALQWGTTYGNVGDGASSLTNPTGIDFDINGSIWLSGHYSGPAATFYSVSGAHLSGPASVNSRGFLVKYSPLGQALNVATIQQTTGSNTILDGLACNANGVRAVGYFSGATLGSNDILIADFNLSAVLQATQRVGGPGDDRAHGICVSNAGYLISGTAANGASIGGSIISGNASFLWNTAPNRVPVLSYLWSTGATTSSIAVSPTQTSVFTVTVSNGINSCTGTVGVTLSPVDTSLALLDPSQLCATGGTARLRAGIASSYQWLFNGAVIAGATTQTYTATQPGLYRAVLTNSLGCRDTTRSVTLTLNPTPPPPNMRYPSMNAVVNKNLSLQARSFAGASYQWLPSAGLNNAQLQSPIFNFNLQQQYLIKINRTDGCVITDTLLVRIFSQRDIYVPTTFTPNGDGANDRLIPRLVGISDLLYFRVFDRWGQLVYQTSNENEGWDGTYKGTAQPMETYAWIAEAKDTDGNIIKRSGTTILLR